MESCEDGVDTEYCEFHNFMIRHTGEMVDKSWFSDINCHIQEDPEYEWDEEKQEYVAIYPDISYVGMEKLKDPLNEVIRDLDLESGTMVNSFKTKLMNFDYVDFYDTNMFSCSRKKRQASPDKMSGSGSEQDPDHNSGPGPEDSGIESTTSSDYDYYDFTTMSPVEEAKMFYSSQLENIANLTTDLLEILNSSKKEEAERRKRASTDSGKQVLTDEEREMCRYLDSMPTKLGELRDGPVWSLAKISVAQIFQSENLILREEIKEAYHILDTCQIDQDTIETTRYTLMELDNFRIIKDYDDGLGKRLDPSCNVPNIYDAQCTCECHKKDKLFIADIFVVLKSMDNFNFSRGGDLFTWYYNDHMKRPPEDIKVVPNVPLEISREIIELDKELIKEMRYVDTFK